MISLLQICAGLTNPHSQAGADFESITGSGERPLTLAILRDEPDIFAELLAYGANPSIAASSVWNSIEAVSPYEMVQAMVADKDRARLFKAALERFAPTTGCAQANPAVKDRPRIPDAKGN